MDLDTTSDLDSKGRDRLVLTGAIDLATRERFVDAGRELIRGGAVTLVLELSGVTFIDSTGIGAMVELTQEADDNGANVILQGASDRIVRLLEITGLSDRWVRED